MRGFDSGLFTMTLGAAVGPTLLLVLGTLLVQSGRTEWQFFVLAVALAGSTTLLGMMALAIILAK